MKRSADRIGSHFYMKDGELPPSVIKMISQGEELLINSDDERLSEKGGFSEGWLRVSRTGDTLTLFPLSYSSNNAAEIIFGEPTEITAECGFAFRKEPTDVFELPEKLMCIRVGIDKDKGSPSLCVIFENEDIANVIDIDEKAPAEDYKECVSDISDISERIETIDKRFDRVFSAARAYGGSDVSILLDKAETLLSEAESMISQHISRRQSSSDSASDVTALNSI